jgi:hypothetical protein
MKRQMLFLYRDDSHYLINVTEPLSKIGFEKLSSLILTLLCVLQRQLLLLH